MLEKKHNGELVTDFQEKNLSRRETESKRNEPFVISKPAAARIFSSNVSLGHLSHEHLFHHLLSIAMYDVALAIAIQSLLSFHVAKC
jgi:hypothetical protein